MNEIGSAQSVLFWITLILAIIFIALGIGLVSGIVFSGRVFMAGGVKYVMGFVLIAYGIFRIGMLTRKMKDEKRENRLAKKT